MKGFSTRSIHVGEIHQLDSVTTPIFQTANFLMNPSKYKVDERDNYIYSRISNPTVRAVEQKLANLCGAQDGVLFSSGMGAITCSLLSVLSENDKAVFLTELYGGTHSLIQKVLPKLGIQCEFFSIDDISVIPVNGAKVVYVESLTNPLLKLTDIELLSKIAHQNGALLFVDNTFMSPYNFRSLEFGADLEIHSVTKYINGHSDVILGFAASKDKDLISKIWQKMYTLGFNPDPFQAYLVGRSVKTLVLRMEKHNQNAKQIAQFLSNHEKVAQIRYPTLYTEIPECYENCPGFGAVVYCDLVTQENALKFVEGLKIFKQATSLAGVESLVTIPSLTSHASLTDEELKKANISKGGVRISVGIEDLQDLIDDIEQALSEI
ncbi:MAG TPA: aminotransferase class I/II-fold pyridoxal phosphate-dependent enzyme [Pseudothermotoga sp.]|nr:aminotransferase class I/II-fold pyridoxal phosphate-dependent enzyme [Pseudothermotoga sp.]HOK83114.1 aminotransferase class I/II-fold pyridoxal phosphate-dependent enzyme [Pseudothermotoga sp.]HPP69715.1 aminotransferase class I/II-fold pyridoxal phosphate-dependent enzyme [Pseudothermotoga sp.]